MATPFRGFERLNRFNYRRNEERWRRDSRPNSTRYKNGRQGQPNKAVAFCFYKILSFSIKRSSLMKNSIYLKNVSLPLFTK
jgi:hypothetical protein